MAEVEQQKQEIQQLLEELNGTIHRSPLFASNPKEWKSTCLDKINRIKAKIQGLNQLIDDLPANSQVKHHIASSKGFSKQLESYRQQFRDRSRGDSIFPGNEESGRGQIDLRAQLIQKGDDTQNRIQEALKSMKNTAEQGISLAQSINQQLDKQIQQLDRINDKVKDTKTSLKRAQKSINYFLKALECDKCMMALILLIVLAMIALIVLLVKKNS